MARAVFRPLAAALAALALAGPAAGQAPPDLHVVIVADTDDRGIGPGCYIDMENIRGLFTEARPANRTAAVQVFAGTRTPNGTPGPNNFNQAAVRDYLGKLPLGPNTGVLVYFTGHGDYDPVDGHRVVLPGGAGGRNRMPNEDVFRAVGERAGALNLPAIRMVAVITDSCCPNVGQSPDRKAPKARPPGARKRSANLSAVVDDLFFKVRAPAAANGAPATAFLDMNGAAENQLAFGPADYGGLFTVGLMKTLVANGETPRYPDDRDGDGVLQWYEVMPRLIQQTEAEFDELNRQAVATGQGPLLGIGDRPQLRQTPQAFCLPPPGANLKLPFYAGVAVEAGVARAGRPGRTTDGGARVVGVDPKGPAAGALQAGDVVRRVNGRTVRNVADWYGTIDFAPDARLDLRVDRGGQAVDVTVSRARR